MSVSQSMRTFLYNRETGAFMGRTASSWGKCGVASFRISSMRHGRNCICGRLSKELWCGLSILSLITRYRVPATVDTITDSSQVWTHLGSHLRGRRSDLILTPRYKFLLSLKKIRLLSAEMFEKFGSFFSYIEVNSICHRYSTDRAPII